MTNFKRPYATDAYFQRLTGKKLRLIEPCQWILPMEQLIQV